MQNISEDQLSKLIQTLINGGFLLTSRQFTLEDYAVPGYSKSLVQGGGGEGKDGKELNPQRIQLPSYPKLGDRIQYYLPLKDGLPDTRPVNEIHFSCILHNKDNI